MDFPGALYLVGGESLIFQIRGMSPVLFMPLGGNWLFLSS
jgi:hypothetical protein